MLKSLMPSRAAILARRAKWGDAHQAFDGKTEVFATERDELIGLRWNHAGLLRLLSGIDLNEEARVLAGSRHLLGESARKLGAIDRLDRIEQRDRLAHLVGLERSDEMELDICVALLQCGPFRMRLLHAILAELALTGVDRLLDDIRRNGLGHGDELDGSGIASGPARGEGNLLLDETEPRRNAG